MSKCARCGRKGLFLKLDSWKLCIVCQAEDAAESKLHKINADIKSAEEEKERRAAKITAEIAKLNDDRRAAAIETDAAKQELQQVKQDANAIRSFVKSMKATMQVVHDDSVWNVSPEDFKKWAEFDLDSVMTDTDLQCLSVKDLAAKYRKIRKDISTVYKSYEQRYTTKTISAMYKLMVLALDAEFENILYTLRFGKLETGITAVKELTAKYYSIATDGNQSIAPTLKRFIVQIESMYLDALHVEYEYYVQRERAKEEQRAIREQMRQEAEERKRLEQERKKVESEESKYQAEIERITAQMQQSHETELEVLRKRLAEVNALLENVTEKKEEIINLQNGKAGTVYVISNIGSFGDHVYKVGMTRRIDPQDRVNELGDASVPFPFDVHSFIFSDDAVALESALHKELDSRRVNKVNLRKEFFNVSIEELKEIVERIDPTAPFKVTALAEQYRQSLSLAEDA